MATTTWYRIGGAFLEVVSDHAPLVDALAVQYGECAVLPPEPDGSRLRCRATLLAGSSLLLLTFEGEPVPNLVDVARGLFWTIRARQCYVEAPCILPGWRMMVNAEHDGRMLVACSDGTAIVDLGEAPTDFVLDCLLDVMQSVQPGVLFVHGASLGVHGVGALFVGHTRRGKSTTALSLASRGHAFFGDDVAAIRVADRHLIPVRASAALRDGPLSPIIKQQIESCGYVLHEDPDGSIRKLVRVGELFPSTPPDPVPLRFAFFLDGFAERPRLTPYQPSLTDLERLYAMMVTWRPTPGYQLMRFLEILDLLSCVRCYLLEVGQPEESAVMIEGVMA